MVPTGWPLALMVWGYSLVSFGVASAIKIAVYRMLDRHAAQRNGGFLHGRKAAP